MAKNRNKAIMQAYLNSLTHEKIQLDKDVKEFLELQKDRNALERDFVNGHLCDYQCCSNGECADSTDLLTAHWAHVENTQKKMNEVIARIFKNPAHLTWMM